MQGQSKSKSIVLKTVNATWFRLSVAAAVLLFLFAGDRFKWEYFSELKENSNWIFLAFLVTLPTYYIVSYRFCLVLKNQGVPVPFKRALNWTMIGSFFDVAMPSSSGGDVVKATYIFRALEPGTRTQGLMAVVFDRILGVLGLFLLAIFSMSIGWAQVSTLPGSLGVFVLLNALTFGVLAFFLLASSRRLSARLHLVGFIKKLPFSDKILKLSECFRNMRKSPKDLVIILLVSMCNHFLWCTCLLCIVIAFGEHVDPALSFSVFPLAIFSNTFGFAGGFGIGTAAFDIIFSNLLNIQAGAAIGLTFQTIQLISRLLGLPFYLYPGSTR
jgi:uncharacterized protein (TIRG00374 family)